MSSRRYIPREQLTAVSLWHMAPFDAQGMPRKNGLADDAAEGPDAGTTAKRAHEEGFRHGLEVGLERGKVAGEANALQYNQQFSRIMAGLERAVAGLDQSVADELVKLAVGLARSVIRHHIETCPDAIVPVVREALGGVASFVQHPRLVMHPDDAEIARHDLAEELAAHNCRIASDEQMLRGDVRIDDADFELDATLATRWNRALASLGLNDDWLD